jgi:hypothetical protein
MSKKKLNTQSITNELEGASAFFRGITPLSQKAKPIQKSTEKPTQKSTLKPAQASEKARDISSDNPREVSREIPTRDEIQEFSFRLRDELKVKVQAEVPHEWQKELDDLARELNVKKLELYRYILGKFLGKVETNEPV